MEDLGCDHLETSIRTCELSIEKFRSTIDQVIRNIGRPIFSGGRLPEIQSSNSSIFYVSGRQLIPAGSGRSYRRGPGYPTGAIQTTENLFVNLAKSIIWRNCQGVG